MSFRFLNFLVIAICEERSNFRRYAKIHVNQLYFHVMTEQNRHYIYRQYEYKQKLLIQSVVAYYVSF